MGYYFEPRRNQLWKYFLVALVGAVIGGMLVILAAPSMLPLAVPELPDNGGPSEAGAAPPDTASDDVIITAIEKVSPSVVGIVNRQKIRTFFGEQQQVSGGSGVVYDAHGHLITNYHVVQGADELVVLLADGRQVAGRLVGSDPRTDLAVVKVNVPDLPVPAFGDSDRLRVGEPAIAIGNPVSLEFQRSATAGIISGLNRTLYQYAEEELGLIQTDAAINPGNSGGPLVNSRGEVIGINSVKLATEAIEGMGFAIPMKTVTPIVWEIITRGYVSRPWVGVYVADNDEARTYLGVEIQRGVYVFKVAPGSPAAAAGLAQGDVILEAGGTPIESGLDLRRAIRARQVGERIEITILRDGRSQTVPVQIGEMPTEE